MTYIISDIHGNILRYRSLMSRIGLTEEDHLYVLGDITDRFPDGVTILQELMQMPNCTVLRGNHDTMFLDAVTKCGRDDFELWYSNGGQVTYKAFRRLPEAERNKIIEFIQNMPISMTIEVNGKEYILAHGSPPSLYNPKDYRYFDENEFAIWNRLDPDIKIPGNQIAIFGHTPTLIYQREKGFPLQIWYGNNKIGIDCGSGFDGGRLACLRLEDMKEFYSE